MCFETKTAVVRVVETSYHLFHCALAFCCGVEDLCGLLLNGELHVWSPWCHEREFSDCCAKVGETVTVQENGWSRAPSLWSVWLQSREDPTRIP